jgi:hypothetical protein
MCCSVRRDLANRGAKQRMANVTKWLSRIAQGLTLRYRGKDDRPAGRPKGFLGLRLGYVDAERRFEIPGLVGANGPAPFWFGRPLEAHRSRTRRRPRPRELFAATHV